MGQAASRRALASALVVQDAAAFSATAPARACSRGLSSLSRPDEGVRRSAAALMGIGTDGAAGERVDLYGLRDEQLSALVESLGEKKFRAKQIREFLYDKGATSFDDMSNLPKALRARLAEEARIGTLSVESEQESRDGTRKRLLRCADGSLIEAVLMPYADNRRTACISSQVGCAMGCTFCATGQMGYSRDLSEAEIFEQAATFAAELKEKGERLSNVVFMGMGEPFRNYDNVLSAARRIRDQLGVGSRKITISTVGIAPQIRRFADDCAAAGGLELGLAISLHQHDDAARSAIMPVNRKHSIDELLDACRYYVDTTNRRVTFEWALIEGENDDAVTARALGARLRGLHCHVNLIPLNPTRGFEGKPSAVTKADGFVAELGRQGVSATLRVRRGIDIDAGCGQLADAASKDNAEIAAAAKARRAHARAQATETMADAA